MPRHLRVEEAGLAEIALDRRADRLGPVRAKGEPDLEGAERAASTERDVDHVMFGPVARDVVLLVRERPVEVVVPADEHDAARLGQEEPLVRVERDRVGAVDAGEEVSRGRRGRRGDPVRAVDVQPDAPRLADVREGVDQVDGAGERRPGGRDHGDGRDARCPVGVDRLGDRLDGGGADRQPGASEPARSQAEQLRRARTTE